MPGRSHASIIKKLALGLIILNLSACSSITYWSHITGGQISLLWDRKPIEELLDDPSIEPKLKDRLQLTQKLRRFAEQELQLPVGNAYDSYTDLKRPYVVWNVYAAPELSLNSYTWCYPIVGCMAYRGYYDKSLADEEAERLKELDMDVRVGGVRAYSTIGYFDDPVLNSFVYTNEVYFVELLIHEIAHRKLFIKDDTKFNENFATAVGMLGAERWYAIQGNTTAFDAYQAQKKRYQGVVAFLLSYKHELETLYNDQALSEQEIRELKHKLLERMRTDFQTYTKEQGIDNRYDAWINSMNNATFSTMSNYQELVPGFLALYEQVGRDWEKFYAKVETISELEKDLRHQTINDLIDPNLADRGR